MELVKDGQEPLNYYAAFGKVSPQSYLNSPQIAPLITPDTYVVSEGANTMDIGRVMMPNQVTISLEPILNFCTFIHANI